MFQCFQNPGEKLQNTLLPITLCFGVDREMNHERLFLEGFFLTMQYAKQMPYFTMISPKSGGPGSVLPLLFCQHTNGIPCVVVRNSGATGN